MKWFRTAAWILGIYLICDVVYVVKSADGIDLLPSEYGHHGWMFLGSDWAIAKLSPVFRHRAKLDL